MNVIVKLQELWEDIYRYSWLYKLKWYLYHRIRQDHLIQTGLPKGQYYDKDSLMEAGILELVDDFVSRDGEDAFAFCDWSWNPDHQEAHDKMIQILHWKHIESVEIEKKLDYLLHEAFKDYCPIQSKRDMTEYERSCLDEYHELEMKKLKKVKKILHMCVDVKDYLWT